MRHLVLFLLLFFTMFPAMAEDSYVAVFCDSGLVNGYKTYGHHIDYILGATSWNQLDRFLNTVKEAAGGRPVVLDICIHGIVLSPDICYMDIGDNLYQEGDLLNHIDRVFPPEQIEAVVQETCFGGDVYHTSIGCYHLPCPPYPVYGVENYMQLVAFSLEEYYHKDFTYLQDLRKFGALVPAKPIESHLDPLYDRIWALRLIYLMKDFPDLN